MAANVRNVRETFNVGSFLDKRGAESVTIRKQRREEGFMKRRSVMQSDDDTHGVPVAVTQSPQLSPQPDSALPPSLAPSDMTDSTMSPTDMAPASTPPDVSPLTTPKTTIAQITELCGNLRSPVESVVISAVCQLRRMLSSGLCQFLPASSIALSIIVITVAGAAFAALKLSQNEILQLTRSSTVDVCRLSYNC